MGESVKVLISVSNNIANDVEIEGTLAGVKKFEGVFVKRANHTYSEFIPFACIDDNGVGRLIKSVTTTAVIPGVDNRLYLNLFEDASALRGEDDVKHLLTQSFGTQGVRKHRRTFGRGHHQA